MIAVRLLTIASILSLTIACGGSNDALYQDSKGALTEFVELLESIETKGDYDKAKPKLEALSNRMEELEKRSKDLTEEEAAALRERLEAEAGDLQQRLIKGMQKMMQFEMSGGLGDMMNGMGG